MKYLLFDPMGLSGSTPAEGAVWHRHLRMAVTDTQMRKRLEKRLSFVCRSQARGP